MSTEKKNEDQEKEPLLSEFQVNNIITAFQEGVFNTRQLDALEEMGGTYSPKELAIELLHGLNNSIAGNPFIHQPEKDHLQKQIFTVKMLVLMILDEPF